MPQRSRSKSKERVSGEEEAPDPGRRQLRERDGEGCIGIDQYWALEDGLADEGHEALASQAQNTGPDAAEGKAPSLTSKPAYVWIREGDYWTIRFGGKEIRLRHLRGLQDIAALLASPELPILSTTLAGRVSASAGTIEEGSEEIRGLQRQLDDLREVPTDENLAKAEWIEGEIKRRTGLGGRVRREGDDTDRARKAVSRRIHLALDRIRKRHLPLARHLDEALKLGRVCVYDPKELVEWLLAPAGTNS